MLFALLTLGHWLILAGILAIITLVWVAMVSFVTWVPVQLWPPRFNVS
jgi:hypothetical protein